MNTVNELNIEGVWQFAMDSPKTQSIDWLVSRAKWVKCDHTADLRKSRSAQRMG